MHYQEVIEFWFAPQHTAYWFKSNDHFDNLIRQNFATVWSSACKGELYLWRETVEGRLAEIIILDQFSRNLNRGSAVSFSQDGMALILAQEIVSQSGWRDLTTDKKAVSLLPWMHSESLAIHQEAKVLFTAIAAPNYLEYEFKHCEIIQRFGRYPHRNLALGRDSTTDEINWMKTNEGF